MRNHFGVQREDHGATVAFVNNALSCRGGDDASLSKLRRSLNHAALAQARIASAKIIIGTVILDGIVDTLNAFNLLCRAGSAVSISLNKLVGHCLLALVGKAGKVVIVGKAGIVATVTILIVEEHAVKTIGIELSLQLKSKLLAVLIVEDAQQARS